MTKFREVGLPLNKNKEEEESVGYKEVLKPYTYWMADPDIRGEINNLLAKKLNIKPNQMQKAWEPGSDELKALSKEYPRLVSKEGLVQPSSEYGFVLSYRIAPRLFKGFVLSQDHMEKATARLEKIMRETCKDDKESLIPIYNKQGDLLWPKQMSYEDVKKFVAEKKKEKEDKK